MGVFIEQYGDTTISEDKYEEFEERIKKIFYLGGSMNVSKVQIFDKTLHLIESPKLQLNFTMIELQLTCWKPVLITLKKIRGNLPDTTLINISFTAGKSDIVNICEPFLPHIFYKKFTAMKNV